MPHIDNNFKISIILIAKPLEISIILILIYTYNLSARGKKMKLKGYIAGIVLLITAFLFAWGCSSVSIMDSLVKEPEKETKEEAADTPEETVESETTGEPAASSGEGLIGTWINTDYNKKGRSAMVVYNDRSDGTLVYTAYDNADGSGDSYEGTVEITKTWTDPEGRIMMKSIVKMTGGMSWDTLTRMSSDGTVLEVQSGTEKIDPDGKQYSIYYRADA